MSKEFKLPEEHDSQNHLSLSTEVLSDTALLIQLTGIIDTYNSQFFTAQMKAVVDAGFTNIILGCKEITYISSTGVGAFTAILKDVASSKGKIIIAEAASKVLDVFHLLGFATFFVVHASLEDAKKEAIGAVQTSASVFPKIFACPICDKKLKATKSGTFRCTECKTGLIVTDHGEIHLK